MEKLQKLLDDVDAEIEQLPSDSDSLESLFNDIISKHKRKPVAPALRELDPTA
jgi:hypothetical protein